jgi:2'-5' RNA ligase
MTDIKLNIALELPAHITRQVIQESKRLAKSGGAEFVLDGNHIIPHITVLMGYFDEKDLPEIKKRIAMIASNMKTIQCSALRPYANRGYIGINIKTTTDLLMLKDSVDQELGNYLKEEAGEPGAFHPHITLLKYKSPRARAPLTKLPAFSCTSLALFEAGKFGTCIRKLQQ